METNTLSKVQEVLNTIEIAAAQLGLRTKYDQSRTVVVSDGKAEFYFEVEIYGRGIYWTENRLSRNVDKASIVSRLRTLSRNAHQERLKREADAERREVAGTLLQTVRDAVQGEYRFKHEYVKESGVVSVEIYLPDHPTFMSGFRVEFRGHQHAIDTVRAILAIK